MSNHSFLQHIKHDVKLGIFGQWKYYIPITLIFIFLCLQMSVHHQQVINSPTEPSQSIEPVLHFGDYIFYMFRGMKIFTATDKEFKVNIFWLVINLYISFVVSFYPFKDLKGYGQLMLLRSQKRSYWWLSKCIWVSFSIFMCYIIAFAVAAIFTLACGEFSIYPQSEMQAYFSETNVNGLTAQGILLNAFLLPVICSISISLLQLFISNVFQPLFGLMITAAVLVCSVFYCVPFLPANFIMLMRNEFVLPGTGIHFTAGICIAIPLAVISSVLGMLIFQKKDLFTQPE